ncbi:MAG: A24 family peptidase C-terminal domain-containing protein [Candidatus Diapherotrites archaeon]
MCVGFFFLLFSISLLGLVWASYTDIKHRVVSNKLCISLALLGLLIHMIISAMYSTIIPFLYSLLALAYTFCFSYALYKLGFWAGGDVKFFSSLAALNPINPKICSLIFLEQNTKTIAAYSSPPLFPLELFVFTIFSMFPLSFSIMLKRTTHRVRVKIVSLIAVSFLVSLALALFGLNTQQALFFFIFLISAIIIACMPLVKTVLVKEKKITELSEGDIVGEIIKVEKGKIIREKDFNIRMLINYMAIDESNVAKEVRIIANPFKARGVTLEEIEELKKLVSQKKLENKILVKDSTPMIPAILFAYVLLNIMGDILWYFI